LAIVAVFIALHHLRPDWARTVIGFFSRKNPAVVEDVSQPFFLSAEIRVSRTLGVRRADDRSRRCQTHQHLRRDNFSISHRLCAFPCVELAFTHFGEKRLEIPSCTEEIFWY